MSEHVLAGVWWSGRAPSFKAKEYNGVDCKDGPGKASKMNEPAQNPPSRVYRGFVVAASKHRQPTTLAKTDNK